MKAEKPAKHEEIFSSVREHMVPMRIWTEYVRRFESNGILQLGLGGISEKEMENFYTVPYPFPNPVYMDIIFGRENPSARGISSFTRQETKAWEKMARDRIRPFVENSVHGDVVSLVDSNYDFGCILQSLTGYVFFFDYSKIKGFEVFSFMEPTAVEGFRQMTLAGRNPATDGIPREIREWMGMNRAFYVPIWKNDKERDIFHPSGDCAVSMTTLVPMDDEQLDEVRKHLFLSFQNHVKCIVIP